ncbi:DUF1028 domain-containing protein [Rhodococcus hoagii]|nr:DUF1028 domain-containing protein [Prescottella equi]
MRHSSVHADWRQLAAIGTQDPNRLDGCVCRPGGGSVVTAADHVVAGNILVGDIVGRAASAAFDSSAGWSWASAWCVRWRPASRPRGGRGSRCGRPACGCTAVQFPLVDLRVDEHPDPLRELAGSGSCTALRPASMSAAQSIPTPHVVSPQERRKPMPELTRTPASVPSWPPSRAAAAGHSRPGNPTHRGRERVIPSRGRRPVSDLVADGSRAGGHLTPTHDRLGPGRAFEATLETGTRDFGSRAGTRRHGLARGSDGRLAHRDERAHHVRARSR